MEILLKFLDLGIVNFLWTFWVYMACFGGVNISESSLALSECPEFCGQLVHSFLYFSSIDTTFTVFLSKWASAFVFFLVINEWFLIMSKLKGLSKSRIFSFICKQPFWKFYWCAICYSYPPAQCTASISDCSISHASQLANPFLGLPLEFGKCESCGTSEPGKCEGE